MRPFIVGATLLALVGATRGAAADEAPSSKGIELAVRAGPSFVAGNAEDGVKMLSQLGVPLMLGGDVGYRFNDKLYLGGLFTVGFGLVLPGPCPADYRCTGPAIVSDIGGVARYHLEPIGALDPWLGAGVAFAVEGSGAERKVTTPITSSSGFCLFGCTSGGGTTTYNVSTVRYGVDALLEGGVDWRLSPKLALGLSLSAFIGTYLSAHVQEKTNGTESGSSSHGPDAGIHVVVFPAVRLVFDIAPGPKAPPPGAAPPPATPGTTPATPATPAPTPNPNDTTL